MIAVFKDVEKIREKSKKNFPCSLNEKSGRKMFYNFSKEI